MKIILCQKCKITMKREHKKFYKIAFEGGLHHTYHGFDYTCPKCGIRIFVTKYEIYHDFFKGDVVIAKPKEIKGKTE